MSRFMSKRGISPLISSVLLIAFVITLFLVITSWISSGVVEETTSSSGDKLKNALAISSINFEIKNVNLVDENTVKINLDNIGEETIEGFSVRVVGSDDVDVVEVGDSINELEVLNKEIDFDNSKVGAVLSVEVFPSVGGKVYGGNSKKKELPLADSCKDILDKNKDVKSGSYDIEVGGERLSVFCDMDTEGGGWTLVWKYNRDSYLPENVKGWGTNSNIASDGYCDMADLSPCSGNHKGILFKNLATRAMAVNMETAEYALADWTYKEFTLHCSVSYDSRPAYSGNIFFWKGFNHRYTKGAGDYYYVGTSACSGGSGSGNPDHNHWRATYLR